MEVYPFPRLHVSFQSKGEISARTCNTRCKEGNNARSVYEEQPYKAPSPTIDQLKDIYAKGGNALYILEESNTDFA